MEKRLKFEAKGEGRNLYQVCMTEAAYVGREESELWLADDEDKLKDLVRREFIQDANVDNEEEMADSFDAHVFEDLWNDTTVILIGEIVDEGPAMGYSESPNGTKTLTGRNGTIRHRP